MASDSKRNTHFPGSSVFHQTLEPPRDGSSPKFSTSKRSGRLHHGMESSRRTPSKLKAEKPALQSRSGETELIPVLKGTPWVSYDECYNLELGGWITVAGKKPREMGEIVAVRSIPNVEEDLYRIKQLRHENVVSVYEIFTFGNSFYIISERMLISLENIVACAKTPDEAELASIIWQLLMAMSYLLSQNMAHGDINCTNILVSREGDVKIAILANPECCRYAGQGTPEQMKDLMAIRPIMVELMEIETGNTGLEDTGAWSGEIMEFYSLTDSPSLQQLKTHAFLKGPPLKGELVLLVDFACTTAINLYHYQAR